MDIEYKVEFSYEEFRGDAYEDRQLLYSQDADSQARVHRALGRHLPFHSPQCI